jgi:hypothetical protein
METFKIGSKSEEKWKIRNRNHKFQYFIFYIMERIFGNSANFRTGQITRFFFSLSNIILSNNFYF